MAFPGEFVNFGKIEFNNCSVFLYASSHNRRAIANIPCGKVVNAWWQGANVAVEMDSGWVYIYSDFGNCSSRYKK